MSGQGLIAKIVAKVVKVDGFDKDEDNIEKLTIVNVHLNVSRDQVSCLKEGQSRFICPWTSVTWLRVTPRNNGSDDPVAYCCQQSQLCYKVLFYVGEHALSAAQHYAQRTSPSLQPFFDHSRGALEVLREASR